MSLRLVLLSHLKYLPCFCPECCNNQKLLLEYEKYQELQLKSQRMQEEYEKQLRDNDETKSQALEELTEFYEAKLQEKTTLLEEVHMKLTVPPSMGRPAGLTWEQPEELWEASLDFLFLPQLPFSMCVIRS